MQFPLASLIGPALRYVGNSLSFVKSKLERKYWTYRILKWFGQEPKKEDFATLYIETIFNLINEKGKRRSIIRLFEIADVRTAFETEIYEKNDWAFRIAFDDHLHTNPSFRNLKTIQVDINQELSDFRDEFIRLINKSRAPKEVESHQKISSMMERFNNLQTGVEDIKQKLGGVEIGNTDKFSKSEVVPLVQNLSKRETAIADILSKFKKKEAVFITGSISTGKTQLSALIFNAHAGPKTWITLKDTSPDNFYEKISKSLEGLGKAAVTTSPDKSWQLIVLDDLPKLEKNNLSITPFVSLILNVQKNNLKLLVTSNFNLPSQITDLIPNSIIEFMSVPFLTVDDTVEVLKSYGASDANCDDFKSIVHVISHGHPTITSAICKFLKAVEWNTHSEDLTRLFKDDYSLELTEETYSDVVSTIEDGETRELLYRLNVIKTSFTNAQVSLVAQIDPPIRLPLEKFNSIVGLWVQRVHDEKYELSPLIERLHSENLNAIVTRKINFNLGLQILAKKKLNQFEAQRAITYFLRGGAADQAGFVLIIALHDALKNPEIFFDWGFNLNWTYEELPKEMDVSTKVYIRILQLMLYIKREKEYASRITFIRNDLEKILLSADPATANYAYASLFLSTLYAKENSSKSLKYFTLGVQFFDSTDQLELREELQKRYNPEQLIWASTRPIKTMQQVDEWFIAFGNLSADRRKKAIELGEVRMGTTFITENLINEEESKESKDQNWNELLKVFENIRGRADALNIVLLSARAIKGIIYITSA